jgi:hypothetical protein
VPPELAENQPESSPTGLEFRSAFSPMENWRKRSIFFGQVVLWYRYNVD